MLDEKSAIPLYRQIYKTIRLSILSGEFQSGKQLPASRLLAQQLNVSRMTVLNAYDQLITEGYLESKTGAGTFVAEHLPEEFLNTPQVKQKSEIEPPAPRELALSAYGKSVSSSARAVLQFSRTTPLLPFQPGVAAIDEFPFDLWTKLANKSYRALERKKFAYGESFGIFALREAIAAHLKSVRAVNCAPEQVIVTSSAQQAFDLISRIFLEPGTEVLIENPCYFGVKHVFQSFDAKLIPVPVDQDGFNLAAAERSGKARLAYVTPSHQYPLGVTMTLARRLQLLEWARTNNAWIIEDDYDSEFRYEGRPLPSLQGLDRDGRVLYIGTFSKTVFPALRLGCLVVPPDLIEIFTAAHALSGAGSPLIEQATLAEFIAEGHYSRHIRRMRRLYEQRQETLVTEINKYLADWLQVKKLPSGMHLIGWLPEGMNDQFVAEKVAAAGIRTATVSSHSLTEWQHGGLILGYTAIDEKQIKEGVKQLAKVFKSLPKK